MCSELECGICYQSYNAARRCPRELRCKHSFCESCLLVLSRAADRLIVCPLCRQTTSISGERTVRAELRVDECVLERLLAAGLLQREEEEEEEEEGDREEDGCDDGEEAASLETPAGQSDSSSGARGGALRRSWRKVWRKILGKQEGGESK